MSEDTQTGCPCCGGQIKLPLLLLAIPHSAIFTRSPPLRGPQGLRASEDACTTAASEIGSWPRGDVATLGDGSTRLKREGRPADLPLMTPQLSALTSSLWLFFW